MMKVDMKKLHRKISQSGTTLLEILIVMAVIGTLSLISMFVYSTIQTRYRDLYQKTRIAEIKTYLYDYFFDTGCFPPVLPACGSPLISGSTVIVKNFPCASDGKPYVYEAGGNECNTWFRVFTNLEWKQDTDIDRIYCRTGCGPGCAYNYGVASSNTQVYENCVRYYACSASGECLYFADPAASRCPTTFMNDPTCGGPNACADRNNKCHDERGKKK